MGPQNLNQFKIYQNIALSSSLALGALGVLMLQPFSFSENTNAVTERTTNGDYYIETTSTDLNLTIETTPAGNQVSSSHDVTVKTDDPAGYTLTVSVNNDTSNALNLNGNTSATEKFAATSGTYDNPKALDENSWGFADTLAKSTNNQWAAVPLLSNAQQLKSTSSANESGDTTTVYYAINAKYDGQHSNGNYSNTIVYSVTGNTIPKKTLDDITYMQDVVDYSDICTNSTEWTSSNNKEYTLKDKRDDNTYTIRKLADGHCWMVTNLRLGKTSTMTLRSSDTDITASTWSLPASISSGFSSYTDAQMHIGSTSDNASWTTSWGNYYNWTAATAGTNPSSGDASSSICPKGWKLPYGGTSDVDYSWYHLASKYGFTGSNYTNSTFVSAFQAATNTGSSYWSGYYRNSLPLDAGSVGYWWSRTALNASYADYLYTSSGYVLPHNNLYYKSYGFTIRCVFVGS